jgi:DHA1 family multidrug resistance protein-like MFS transporter
MQAEGAVPAQTAWQPANRRGLIVILVDTFFMWGGFFMVVPLISVYYVDRLGWAAATVGLVLGVRQLAQQGLSPLSGMLADRLGAKGPICAGLAIRAVGFAALAWATTFPILLASVLLAALGGALFDSPKSAAIAALTDETNRGRFYSLLGVVSGLGVALGTQVGALLLAVDFGLVALLSAACFIATFVITLVLLPPVQIAAERRGLTTGFRLAFHDRPFVSFTLLLLGYWFLWVQFSISLPLLAKDVSGTTDAVSWIYGINSGMNIFLQYPLLRLVERRLRPLPTLILGIVVMAAGFGGLALIHTVPGLLFCVMLISTGMLLAAPSQQTVTAGLTNPAALGSYFGVSSLAVALGGGLGNVSGGLLYDLGRQFAAPALAWAVFALVGFGTAAGLGLTLLRRRAPVAPPQDIPAPGPAR